MIAPINFVGDFDAWTPVDSFCNSNPIHSTFAEILLVAYNGNMQILTTAEMRACDERTVKEHGVKNYTLMEHAGEAVARFVLQRYSSATRITILCGKGNNGGDGMVTARHLAIAGKQVVTILLAEPDQLQGSARRACDQLPENPRLLTRVADLDSPDLQACFAQTDLFIDAIFGAGFRPPLKDLPLAVCHAIAKYSVPVVAVDLPSGWDADATAMQVESVFRADAVVTFTAPKLAHVFGALTGPTKRGPIVVAEIGSPSEAIVSSAGLHWTGSAKSIVEQPRVLDGNKGRYGHVLVVGGSAGKSGAPAMAALAAMRAGAGLATVAVPKGIAATVATFAPEMMTYPLEETESGSIAMRSLDSLQKDFLAEQKFVLAVGPGLGRNEETAEFVRHLVMQTKLPLVLDADGLNAFEGKADLLDGRGRTMVLTPHPGEMARLLGTSIAAVEQDRIQTARTFAQQHHVTLVLKGWRTLVAHPDGAIGVNTSGNPAMAKGGSGDILTGIVAALLGQYKDHVAEAVEAAVWVHGAAADAAVREQNEHTLLATDTLAHLSQAFCRPVFHDGFTWLQEGQP
ncbi:MAG TPA: NAD(P)H-hydrate dehydratase [Acidobacteriaceae bacterium]|nr:NAD(P)H-hydrate dehydratase [Acidobacteriaceae bacterium]